MGMCLLSFPEEAKDIYLDYLRPTAESLGLRCESLVDFKAPGDVLPHILSQIQKAEILVFDITECTPDVMLQLGLALAIKDPERVIVIREKSDEPLPLDIYSHCLTLEYDRNSEESFSNLTATLREVLNRTSRSFRKPRIESPETVALFKGALNAIEKGQWVPAQALFEIMDSKEPENWFIYNQWGIMLRAKGNEFEAASDRFNKALTFTEFDEEKAFIYTELAVLNQKNRKYDEAVDWFKKAERADSKNSRLCLAWAEYYDELRDYFSAQAKIGGALARIVKDESDPNYRELMLRYDYYAKKITTPTYRKKFEQFKSEQMRPSVSCSARKKQKSSAGKKQKTESVEGRPRGGGRLDGRGTPSKPAKPTSRRPSHAEVFFESNPGPTLPIETMKPQPVLLGASAPRAVRPGDSFAVRFIAYVKELERTVRTKLKQLSQDSETYLAVREAYWRIGTRVKVQLYSPHLLIPSPEEQFTWRGSKEIIDFRAQVPTDISARKTVLCFNILIGDISVTDFVLELRITSRVSEEEPIFRSKKPASTGFASYSSKDTEVVFHRISEIRLSGLDLWTDCLDLSPGEEWQAIIEKEIMKRDLFLLFWSTNAKESPWVRWEWKTALREKGLFHIQPRPLDQTSPPRELNKLHFRDRYMLILQAYKAAQLGRTS